eukprot:2280672-Rhodomonas_salina.3
MAGSDEGRVCMGVWVAEQGVGVQGADGTAGRRLPPSLLRPEVSPPPPPRCPVHRTDEARGACQG